MINVVGCHTGGDAGNVIVGGLPPVPGRTMLDKRRHLQEESDWIRQLLLKEPRGNVMRSVNAVFPSSDPDAAMGYVIMESTEYPVMSGSNTICVATVLLETGMVEMRQPVTNLTLESPAGLIQLSCTCRDGKVTGVTFVNQPAFVYHLAAPVEVEGLGTIKIDVAWGGMAYAIVDAPGIGFGLHPSEARELSEVGQRIKRAAAEQLPVKHPENPEFAGITQTEFTLPVRHEEGVLVGRNAVIVSPGRIDRSPCGTGTSARLAVLHARGQIAPGECFVSESIVGSRFDTGIQELTRVGGVEAIVPRVTGQAWITDFSQVVLDPTDPFPTGYTLSDTWMHDEG
jgi:proline racemase